MRAVLDQLQKIYLAQDLPHLKHQIFNDAEADSDIDINESYNYDMEIVRGLCRRFRLGMGHISPSAFFH